MDFFHLSLEIRICSVINEFSSFPFAFPCTDITASTVISCVQPFALFGMPAYIHSDRDASFISEELRDFLLKKGRTTSCVTSYNPRGNGQVERYDGIIWKTVMLAFKTRNLDVSQWESVLPDALHSIRSLLCTSSNCTPHKRFLQNCIRSTRGQTLLAWLILEGPTLLRQQVWHSKNDPLVEEVEIVEGSPEYAHVRLPDYRVTAVSLRHLTSMANDSSESPDANSYLPQPWTTSEVHHASVPLETACSNVHVHSTTQQD